MRRQILSSKRGIVRTVAGGISTRIEPLQAPEFVARRSRWMGLGCVGCTLAVLDAALVVLDARGRVGCILVESYATLFDEAHKRGAGSNEVAFDWSLSPLLRFGTCRDSEESFLTGV
jgi:hypothetical protein